MDGHAWHSPDGRIWRRASDPPAWSGAGDQALTDACALPGGGFVALAYSVVQGLRNDSVWLSADGDRWEPARDGGAKVPGGPLLSELSCTAATGAVLVAGSLPSAGGEDLVVLRTADGRAWTLAGALLRQADDPFAELAADGDRIVVAAGLGGDIGVFSSADGGATWHEHAVGAFGAAGYQGPWHALIAGDQVLTVGQDNASGAVWLGPAP